MPELVKQLREEAAALSGRPDYRYTVDLLDAAADALQGLFEIAEEGIGHYGYGAGWHGYHFDRDRIRKEIAKLAKGLDK